MFAGRVAKAKALAYLEAKTGAVQEQRPVRFRSRGR
jgi:hypothetical protein